MIDSTKTAGLKLYTGGPDHGDAVVTNVTCDNFVIDASDYAFQAQSCYGEEPQYCNRFGFGHQGLFWHHE